MEAVYLRKKYSTNSISQNVQLNEYFREYTRSFNDFLVNKERMTEFYRRNAGVGEEEVKKLSKDFSFSQIKLKHKIKKEDEEKVTIPIEGFRSDFKLYEVPKHNTTLKTVAALKNRTDRDITICKTKVKYPGEFDMETFGNTENKDKIQINDLRPLIDYLVTVRVYLPCLHLKYSSGKVKPLQVSEEILVPSTLTLDALRDRIACQTDFQPLEGDVSQDPVAPTTLYAKDTYKSAMFYIGNVFYIDCRFPTNIDYSEPIRKWGREKKLELNYVLPMETTKISQLKEFRFGYPYVYVHQGDCEHLIVFTDARLLLPRDNLLSSAYPMLKSFGNLRGHYCMTCGTRIARYIVTDTDRLPSDNTYMCTLCLYLYNYIDNKKIDNFKVYKYIDRVAIF